MKCHTPEPRDEHGTPVWTGTIPMPLTYRSEVLDRSRGAANLGQCRLVFGKLGLVGRTPWSARDALVPLFLRRIRHLPTTTSRPGGWLQTRASAHQVEQV